MKTRIIHKFRVDKRLAYKSHWERRYDGWYKITERDSFNDHYRLQQKRAFWFGYKTLEKSSWKDDLIEKMETLKKVYGVYA